MQTEWQPFVGSRYPWWQFWSDAKLWMRRRDANGRWEYREPTRLEADQYQQQEAW